MRSEASLLVRLLSDGSRRKALWVTCWPLCTDRSRLCALRSDVDLSVHSALFTWLVRHAQWLVNRYLCNAEGTTAFERRWRKKYAGFLCRFGETVLFRRPHPVKGRAALAPGVWLGKDTESDQHFVADGSVVFKTRSVKRHPLPAS